MIVIEIRIGREAPAQTPGLPTAAPRQGVRIADPRALASAFRPRKMRTERWIWRLGRRGIAAAVASVLGVASLAFVPGSSNPEVVAVGNSMTGHAMPGAIAGSASTGRIQASASLAPGSHVDADAMRVDAELDRMARDMTARALARVRGRTSTDPTDMPDDAHNAHGLMAEAAGVVLETAVGAVPSEVPAPIIDSRLPEGAGLVERLGPSTEALSDPSLSAVASAAAADPDQPEEGGAAVADAPVSAAADSTADAVAADPAFLTITRSVGTPDVRSGFLASDEHAIRGRLAELHEQASRGAWASVRSDLVLVRKALSALPPAESGVPDGTELSPGSGAANPDLCLSMSKLEARAALLAGDAAGAVAVLDGLGGLRDDEARALQAVALLRSGDGMRAVETYRDLIARAPQDARLWLGLGMALESAEGNAPEAVRFAYLQALELTADEAVRSVARSRLAPPQA